MYNMINITTAVYYIWKLLRDEILSSHCKEKKKTISLILHLYDIMDIH